MTGEPGLTIRPKQDLEPVVHYEVPMTALGVQIILPQDSTACLEAAAVEKVAEATKLAAQEIILEAQQLAMARAKQPFERATAEDVSAAIQRLAERKSRQRTSSPWWSLVLTLSSIGLGAAIPSVVKSSSWPIALGALTLAVLVGLACHKENPRT